MPSLRHTLFILTTVSGLALSGCQTVTKAPIQPVTPPLGTESGTSEVIQNNFDLQGKIGVKTPQQSGSAFFTWTQHAEKFEIQLTGILGIGKTIIEGDANQVTLNSSKTGEITADSPEELLERATGWIAPIRHIVSWVQARPATTNAQINKDDFQRINQIQEDDWDVTLSYTDQATLPNKLILKQQLEGGKENRITMVIQNR